MDSPIHKILQKERTEINLEYDAFTKALWLYFTPSGRDCFNLNLLNEMHDVQKEVMEYYKEYNSPADFPIRFFLAASLSEGVYNYGGDLNLFAQLIEDRNAEHLKIYAEACIKCVYYHATNLDLPLTTISLVQGTALGGGLEAALAGNVLIAEEGVKMGFPEIKFNLFPGMGAYSFLARKVGLKLTEEILHTGKLYTSDELSNMGVVDRIATSGCGVETANQYMKKANRSFNGMQAIRSASKCYNPLNYKELSDIVQIWVDAALQLGEKDLKMMRKLVGSQRLKVQEKANAA